MKAQKANRPLPLRQRHTIQRASLEEWQSSVCILCVFVCVCVCCPLVRSASRDKVPPLAGDRLSGKLAGSLSCALSEAQGTDRMSYG